MGIGARRIIGGLTQAAANVMPPAILEAGHWAKSRFGRGVIEWEYVPAGWLEADRDPKVKGWNVESVLKAYEAKWPAFVASVAGPTPFGSSPEASAATPADVQFQNALLSYAFALHTAARNRRTLTMLDWGGGIGHYNVISRAMLTDIDLCYSCVDVPLLANYGQKLFPDARFYSDDAWSEHCYDFVLASCSLQYSPDWAATLRRLAQSTNGYLFVTRVPLVRHVPSFVVVQRPYQYDYDTEYLGWYFNRDELMREAAAAGLTFVREFLLANDLHYTYRAPEQAHYAGLLFRREAADETTVPGMMEER